MMCARRGTALDQDGGGESGEEGLNSGYVLKLE